MLKALEIQNWFPKLKGVVLSGASCALSMYGNVCLSFVMISIRPLQLPSPVRPSQVRLSILANAYFFVDLWWWRWWGRDGRVGWNWRRKRKYVLAKSLSHFSFLDIFYRESLSFGHSFVTSTFRCHGLASFVLVWWIHFRWQSFSACCPVLSFCAPAVTDCFRTEFLNYSA